MEKYFFLDDEHLAIYQNMERVFHQPVKHGPPVLAPETALEGDDTALWNPPMLADDGHTWRMWYIGGTELFPLYAESQDGIHWSRPCLDLVEHEGNKHNNMIDLGADYSPKERRLVMAVNPSADRADRKYCALLSKDDKYLRSIFSADGMTWHARENQSTIPCNDEYRLVYDAEKDLLLATVKHFAFMGGESYGVPEYGRCVYLYTSQDALTWENRGLIFYADASDCQAGIEVLKKHLSDPDYRSPIYNSSEYYWTDIYNMPILPYYGTYIGFPTMFHHSGYWPMPNQDGILQPALTWSTDLKHWKRPIQRKAFIPPSPCTNKDIFDNGAVNHCCPVERDGELWFYYTGLRSSHVHRELLANSGLSYAAEKGRHAIFLARLRLDGFASIEAGNKTGALLTTPLKVTGSTLRVNVRAKDGEIRAEIRDAESGNVIPGFGLGDYLASPEVVFPDGTRQMRQCGFGTRHKDVEVKNDTLPFSGDEVDAPMTWRGGKDISALKGREIRILFAARNAAMYSFWFGQPE